MGVYQDYTTLSLGTNSLVSDETPTGLVNSSNTVYSTSRAYIGGTLEVYVNGLKKKRGTDFTETTAASGVFTMTAAPTTGQTITTNYQFTTSVSSNADTVDGFHANATATANQLLPLDSNAKISNSNLYVPSKFSVYRANAFSPAVGAAIQFDTKTYDTGTNVDIVTNKGRFTAPVAGFYSFTANLTMAYGGSGNIFSVALYKNGLLLKQGTQVLSTGAQTICGGVSAASVQLATNDYVEVWSLGASTSVTTGAAYTSFDGFLVSAL